MSVEGAAVLVAGATGAFRGWAARVADAIEDAAQTEVSSQA